MAKLEARRSRQEFGSRMSVLLSNPDYLLEGFAEKKCQFVGVIEGIATTASMSDRNKLLFLLDTNRNSGKLPWRLTGDHNATLTISAYNVKIIKENRGGAILHRLPLHQVASASYINDDNQHLVFMKGGDANQDHCDCYIFMFSKRAEAEEVCAILQQAFQLVYTEATMEHLNESIIAGERGSRLSRTSSVLLGPSKPRSPVHFGTSPPKPATPPHVEGGAFRQTPNAAPSVPTLVEETITEAEIHDDSASAVELVQDYMERLHKLLDFKELREFATLLKTYREDLKVDDFLTKLRDLYGKHREFLIPDMNSFIPEEDKPGFEKFLSDNNLHSAAASQAPHPPLPPDAVGTGEAGNFSMDLNENILTTNF